MRMKIIFGAVITQNKFKMVFNKFKGGKE